MKAALWQRDGDSCDFPPLSLERRQMTVASRFPGLTLSQPARGSAARVQPRPFGLHLCPCSHQVVMGVKTSAA